MPEASRSARSRFFELCGLRVHVRLQVLRRALQNFLHAARQRAPAGGAGQQIRGRINVSGQAEILLHFVELLAVDLTQRILLPVDHSGLQGHEGFRERHGRGIRSQALEQAHAPAAAGRAQLDARQVFGAGDRPPAVGDMAEAVLPHGEQLEPALRGVWGQTRPDDAPLDGGHVGAVFDQIGHLEKPEGFDGGGHDRRGDREIHRAQFQLDQQGLVVAELA